MSPDDALIPHLNISVGLRQSSSGPPVISNNAKSSNVIEQKSHWTTRFGQAAGHPAAFIVVTIYATFWLVFSSNTFEWNAVATLAVWMMTLFIQRSNRRDTLAVHAKLDELIRAHNGARSELTRLDQQEPEEIERHRDYEHKNQRL